MSRCADRPRTREPAQKGRHVDDVSGQRAALVDPGVYARQQDSRLLIDAATRHPHTTGGTAVDLFTDSGVVAIALAAAGAVVSAYDISARAVACARANASAAGVDVAVHHGSVSDALARGPYDLVVCNPPYVPTPEHTGEERIPEGVGPVWAWNAGRDGRGVLDPICGAAPRLLTRGGSLMVVQSEFSGIDHTVRALREAGLVAEVHAVRSIPFGPVLTARARLLEETGDCSAGVASRPSSSSGPTNHDHRPARP